MQPSTIPDSVWLSLAITVAALAGYLWDRYALPTGKRAKDEAARNLTRKFK